MAINTGQVTVDATAGGVTIYTARDYTNVVVRNNDTTSTNTVVLGIAGTVTTGTGFILPGGSSVTIPLQPNEALAGIRGTANSVLVCWIAGS